MSIEQAFEKKSTSKPSKPCSCIVRLSIALNSSGGSGSDFIGFGLKSLLGFWVRVHRVLFAQYVSGLTGFGFKASNS